MSQLFYCAWALGTGQVGDRAGFQPALLYGVGINPVEYAPIASACDFAKLSLWLMVCPLACTYAQKTGYVFGA